MTKKKIYPWVVVGLLWGVALLNYMDRQMLSVMKPAMQADIVELRSAANFGYLMAIFLWVYGFMSPVSGIIADRLNRKWLIVISLFVWSGVTVAMSFATTFNQLYWLRGVMGLSEALYIPAGLSLIADFHSSKTRSLAIGTHMTGFYFGQALGGFGATAAAAFSWQKTFQTFGMAGVIYSLVLILLLRDKKRPADPVSAALTNGRKASVLKGLGVLAANRSFWVILFYFAVSSLPGWATKNWLPTLFAQSLNIPMAQAGPLSTITIAASSFTGVLFGGLLSDRWSQQNAGGRVFTSAIGLFFTVPALLMLGFGHTLFTIVSGGVFFGLGFGMFDANNMPILCQFVPVKSRATAYGLMNMTGVFFGAFITDVLGNSSDAGNLGKDFAMLAVVVLIAIAALLYFLRPVTHDFDGPVSDSGGNK